MLRDIFRKKCFFFSHLPSALPTQAKSLLISATLHLLWESMRATTEPESETPQPATFSGDLEHAVRDELAVMLAAPIFAQSSRCKKFLSFVVLETLSGNANHLKERTVGINVFDRANDYDTGDDSIVRVTANEVRKRIGQFYLESPRHHSVQIDLPRGAYVPEFRLNPGGDTGLDHRAVSSHLEPDFQIESPSERRAHSESALDAVEVRQSALPKESVPPIQEGHPSFRRLLAMVLAVAILVCCSSGYGFWRMHLRHRPPDVWGPFHNADVPALVCLGAHNLPPTSPTLSSADAYRFPNFVLRKQVIPVDDAAVIASMGSMLAAQGIPFRVTSADPTELPDLRRQPVVLIGALDNKWSIRIAETLPYTLERIFPAGEMGIWTGSIIDAHDPSQRWKVDFGVPMSDWQKDYALIARFDDPLTGVPVLLEGGLGNNGSLAASEFLTSHKLETVLAKEPSCSGKSSFEVVIGTDIVDAKAGPPHALRIACW
jgi:hypothetical protein